MARQEVQKVIEVARSRRAVIEEQRKLENQERESLWKKTETLLADKEYKPTSSDSFNREHRIKSQSYDNIVPVSEIGTLIDETGILYNWHLDSTGLANNVESEILLVWDEVLKEPKRGLFRKNGAAWEPDSLKIELGLPVKPKESDIKEVWCHCMLQLWRERSFDGSGPFDQIVIDSRIVHTTQKKYDPWSGYKQYRGGTLLALESTPVDLKFFNKLLDLLLRKTPVPQKT